MPATLPDNARKLMRSRYSAYVLRLSDYLLQTWHPDTRPATLDLPDAEQLRWLGLEIRAQKVGASGQRARVEFFARYREQGGTGEDPA